MDRSLPGQAIGIFDSGVGGLTVMHQLMQSLPQERLIYFGDTARLPYGNKSDQTIIRYAIENTICLIEKNIKLLVVACNTVSALALSKLRALFKLPIIGVIEPGVKQALAVTRHQRIAVLGTKGTIQSGAYQRAIQIGAPEATIIPIACPLFVSLVEEQWINHPATYLIIQDYLRPLKGKDIDTLVLGCTHYPFLRALIQQEVGTDVCIVDSGSSCAQEVERVLDQKNLLSPLLQGHHQYFVSDDPSKFRSLAEYLFGFPLNQVELVPTQHLYAV